MTDYTQVNVEIAEEIGEETSENWSVTLSHEALELLTYSDTSHTQAKT